MKLKAYRMLSMDYNKEGSFDVWYDEKLIEYLYDKFQFFVMIDDDGVGFAVLPVEALSSALLNVSMREDVRDALKRDIEANKVTGWVRYVFFYSQGGL